MFQILQSGFQPLHTLRFSFFISKASINQTRVASLKTINNLKCLQNCSFTQDIARQKIDMAALVPSEPELTHPNAVSIMFKLPNGQRIERRFLNTESLKVRSSHYFIQNYRSNTIFHRMFTTISSVTLHRRIRSRSPLTSRSVYCKPKIPAI